MFMIRIHRVTIAWLCIVAIFLTACDAGTESRGLEFNDSWVRATPPGKRMTAAYGILENHTSSDVELTAWSSPVYADVSLHTTELIDGVSRMREVPALVIPAGKSVVLAPGGYHLMLMMPLQDVEPGQSVALEANARDGRIFSFEAPVERR